MGPGEGNVIAHNGGGGTYRDPGGFLMTSSIGQVSARGNRFYDNRPVAIEQPFKHEQPFKQNVTSGCGVGTTYCPSNPNTRGQMAIFLVKALRLP
jgi:hypothetical protein